MGEIVDGFRSGEPDGDEGELDGPVLLGPGCEIGDDVRIDGPAVIGDGAKIGAGQPAARRDRPARAPSSPRAVGPDRRHPRRPRPSFGRCVTKI